MLCDALVSVMLCDALVRVILCDALVGVMLWSVCLRLRCSVAVSSWIGTRPGAAGQLVVCAGRWRLKPGWTMRLRHAGPLGTICSSVCGMKDV